MEREKGVVIDVGSGGGDDGKGEQKQQELLGVKLRRGISVATRGGTSTPVPTWKVDEDHHVKNHENTSGNHRRSTSNPVANTAVSARKLGANLWEIQDLLPISRMSRRDCARSRHRHHKGGKNLDLAEFFPLSPHDRARSTGVDGWHAAASLIQHHKSSERNGHNLQPISPASYTSSMEIAACNQAMTPTSSLDLKGKLGESGYSLKTSTELLKVLNRIWSLEEQHASNISMVKALKLELDHARTRIQDLVEERQVDRHEKDNLLKKLAENKLVRKSKEREKIRAAVQSVKDEVEDERRLRKHSENLHRKIAKEFSEVKSSYSKALIDLERERKVRGLLEDLCDEFAKGVGDYEQEVRELKQKSEKDFVHRCDRLILHISEAWLDERLQMKLAEARGDFTEINTIIDRLGCEIESFLQARRINAFGNGIMTRKDAREDSCIRRQSLESVHLNGATSAPQDAEDDDSVASDLHCFELNMGNSDFAHDNFKNNSEKVTEKLDARKSNISKKKVGYAERITGQSSSNVQLQFEEQNERTSLGSGNKIRFVDRVQRIHLHHRGESEGHANHLEFLIPNETEESGQWNDPNGSDNVVENSSKGQLDFSDGCRVHPENDLSWRGQSATVGLDTTTGDIHSVSSPVQQWKYRSTPDTGIAESSSKLPRGVKENTLKAKLLEARLEGQHARLRTSKGSSFCGQHVGKELHSN